MSPFTSTYQGPEFGDTKGLFEMLFFQGGMIVQHTSLKSKYCWGAFPSIGGQKYKASGWCTSDAFDRHQYST